MIGLLEDALTDKVKKDSCDWYIIMNGSKKGLRKILSLYDQGGT